MFSLNGAVKYKYIPNYQDMRGGYGKRPNSGAL